MLDEKKSLEMLEEFSMHYNYDTGYMKDMLTIAPEAYENFEAFLPMASFSKDIPMDVLFIAKILATQQEDCSSCLQLNVDMAVEAGVDKDILRKILFDEGKGLSMELKNVYDFVLAIAQNRVVDNSLYAKMDATYSKNIMIELALSIASAKVFPTIKRTLNQIEGCSLIEVKI